MHDRARCFSLALLLAAACGAAPAQDNYQPGAKPTSQAEYLLAKRLMNDGKNKEAAAHLKAIIASDPKFVSAPHLLGLWYTDQGDYEDAVKYLESARKAYDQVSDPTSSQKHWRAAALNSLGWAYMVKGDAKRAEVAFLESRKNEALLDQSEKVKLYNNLGWLYMTTGRYPESRAILTKSAKDFNSEFAKTNLDTVRRLETKK
jgi:tetratricopeptide (TPR) repeat protein